MLPLRQIYREDISGISRCESANLSIGLQVLTKPAFQTLLLMHTRVLVKWISFCLAIFVIRRTHWEEEFCFLLLQDKMQNFFSLSLLIM